MIENAIITVAPKELTFIHNIRRANGQGGSVSWDGMDGLSMIPGIPLEASMAVLGPELQAELLASTAVLRAEMPAFAQDMRQLRFDMPKIPPIPSMEHWNFEFSPDQQKQLDKLQKQLDKQLAPSQP